MSLQIDFVIAVGLFFIVFLLVLGSTNSYFDSSMESSHVHELRDNSQFLLGLLYSEESDLSIAGSKSIIESTGEGDSAVEWPARSITVIKHSEAVALQSRDYLSIKDSYNLDDFHVAITDYLDFGPAVPAEGDIVSMYKPVLYERNDGTLVSRDLIVYSW